METKRGREIEERKKHRSSSRNRRESVQNEGDVGDIICIRRSVS